MKPNKLPLERAEGKVFASLLRKNGYVFTHIPNRIPIYKGGATYAWIAEMKAMGLQVGFPDYLIFGWQGRPLKIAIELKRQKGGRPTDSQNDWLTELTVLGWQCAVCHGWEQAFQFVKDCVDSKNRSN